MNNIYRNLSSSTAKAQADLTPVTRPVLQRKCACGKHTMGSECVECNMKKQALQRKAYGRSEASEVPSVVQEVLRSPGQSLDPQIRAFFEPRFGHDFSQVRVHADAKAAESAQAVNALAYTVGRDVVFDAGQYVVGTSVGQRLLAHELTHVVQQNSIPSTAISSSNWRVSMPSQPSERQADQTADQVVGDRPVGVTNTNAVSVQRKEGTGTSESETESSEEQANSSRCTSNFPCLRTPFPPGKVRFTDCTDEQLSDYAVIPENGSETVTPTNDIWFDSDGFWSRHHQPSTEWFKVPGHCDATITCEDHDFSCVKCCNIFASLFKGRPRWSRDNHDARNPFSNT